MTIYIQREFQNFLEKSLCSCFGQLSHIHQQSIQHGIGMILIVLMVFVLDIFEAYRRFTEYFAILAGNALNSLLDCNITRLSIRGGRQIFANINWCRILVDIEISDVLVLSGIIL